MNAPALSRRQAVAALASSAALPLLSGCARTIAPATTGGTAPTNEASANALLDSIANNLLKLQP